MINTTGYVQHPFSIDGRFKGEVAFDDYVNKFIVWNGSHWRILEQSSEFEDTLSATELADVRNYIKNKKRFDDLLKDHFPEDML